jgi:hypothetical protein
VLVCPRCRDRWKQEEMEAGIDGGKNRWDQEEMEAGRDGRGKQI